MNLLRLEEILSQLPKLRILVLGDFFLDQYWVVDPSLVEQSLETGRQAHQVVNIRLSPGAAGTVVNNLAGLQVGAIEVIGFRGNDGNGWELDRGLREAGARTTGQIASSERKTPVYTKPMMPEPDGEVEAERYDIKNRTPTPARLQDQIIARLRRLFPVVDGVVVLDQVQEDECGVVTARVRDALEELARKHPEKPVLADSRSRIGEFRSVSVKPNLMEAASAVAVPSEEVDRVLETLARVTQRPVYLTRGSGGISLRAEGRSRHLGIIPTTGPIDPVGAGDSVNAAVIAALASGAAPLEAAQLGLLASSVTVHKLGTTGIATPREILEKASRNFHLLVGWNKQGESTF